MFSSDWPTYLFRISGPFTILGGLQHTQTHMGGQQRVHEILQRISHVRTTAMVMNCRRGVNAAIRVCADETASSTSPRAQWSTYAPGLQRLGDLPRNQRLAATRRAEQQHAAHVVLQQWWCGTVLKAKLGMSPTCECRRIPPPHRPHNGWHLVQVLTTTTTPIIHHVCIHAASPVPSSS